jgi:hypothetical protein
MYWFIFSIITFGYGMVDAYKTPSIGTYFWFILGVIHMVNGIFYLKREGKKNV